MRPRNCHAVSLRRYPPDFPEVGSRSSGSARSEIVRNRLTRMASSERLRAQLRERGQEKGPRYLRLMAETEAPPPSKPATNRPQTPPLAETDAVRKVGAGFRARLGETIDDAGKALVAIAGAGI